MAPTNQTTALLKKLAKDQLEHASTISDLKNDVADLKEGMQRVLFLLENDDKTDSKGIVAQVRENTSFRSDFKSKTTVLGMVGGAIIGIAFWLLKLIFKQ